MPRHWALPPPPNTTLQFELGAISWPSQRFSRLHRSRLSWQHKHIKKHRSVGHAARMRHEYIRVVGKPEGKTPPGTSRCGWKYCVYCQFFFFLRFDLLCFLFNGVILLGCDAVCTCSYKPTFRRDAACICRAYIYFPLASRGRFSVQIVFYHTPGLIPACLWQHKCI